jgi:hypothetical protein
MAEITIAVLRDFVIKHGNLKIVDSTGKTRILQPNMPDPFDLVEKADRFEFQGRWYPREEFSKLLDEIKERKRGGPDL